MTEAVALAHLRQAFQAAIAAAHPAQHLGRYLPAPPRGRLVVVGAGKAAAAMAQAVESHYTKLPLEGLVITRYGHALPTTHIEVAEAAHPVPDEAGAAATARLLKLCRGLGQDDLLLCLISGGGSALLTAPAGLSLAESAALTQDLLKSGATIREMNVVRKHLSNVKGGRLAAAAGAARVVSLILSDVVGDHLPSIASGPTVPDESSYQDALDILERYDLRAPAARQQLERGLRGEVPETPKPGDPVFEGNEVHLVASAQQSLAAAKAYLESQTIPSHILSSSVEGEARDVAKVHAAIARQVREHGEPFSAPCALLSGGETTVTVRHSGRGGRNGEFALSLACELNALNGVYALAADTDGIDGSEANAGAFVTPDMFSKVGLKRARDRLEHNDSYSYFEEADLLFRTGPTNTNVNDLRIILIV